MAHVQSKWESSTATVHTMQFTVNPTAGNTILVMARRSNASNNLVSCTDSQGNTYTEITGPGGNNSGSRRFWIFKAENVNGLGSVTVSLTYTLQVTIKWIIAEYNNVPASGAVEDFDWAQFAASTTPVSGNVATTVSGDTIVSFMIVNLTSAGTIGPGSGETERIDDAAGFLTMQDKVAGAPGNYNASWVLGSAQDGAYAVLALKSSGGVGNNGNAGGSIGTITASAPTATATSNTVDVTTLRALTYDSHNKPSRLTTKMSATQATPADCINATKFRWAVSGGTGLATVDPDGRLRVASTVTQVTWAHFSNGVWSGDILWDTRGLFPFCIQPTVPDKTYVSASAISTEDFSVSFNDDDTAGVDLTYSMIGPAIPGLTLDADTGILSGTPSTPGDYLNLVVRCTDMDGSYAQTSLFNRFVEAAPNAPFFFGVIGPSFSADLGETFPDIDCGANFQFCTSFALTGTLPAGQSFSTVTGVISGQPTERGLFTLFVTGSGTGTPAVSNVFTIEIISTDVEVVVSDMPTITVTPPTAVAEARALWMKVDMPVEPGWLVIS